MSAADAPPTIRRAPPPSAPTEADFLAAVRALPPKGKAALFRFAMRYLNGYPWDRNMVALERELARGRREAER